MLHHGPMQIVDVKNNPHSPHSARGTLTPSFGHLHAVSKQEEGCALAEPTLEKYLGQAENQSIMQSFILGKNKQTNLILFHLHQFCELIQGGQSCGPLLPLISQCLCSSIHRFPGRCWQSTLELHQYHLRKWHDAWFNFLNRTFYFL